MAMPESVTRAVQRLWRPQMPVRKPRRMPYAPWDICWHQTASCAAAPAMERRPGQHGCSRDLKHCAQHCAAAMSRCSGMPATLQALCCAPRMRLLLLQRAGSWTRYCSASCMLCRTVAISRYASLVYPHSKGVSGPHRQLVPFHGCEYAVCWPLDPMPISIARAVVDSATLKPEETAALPVLLSQDVSS